MVAETPGLLAKHEVPESDSVVSAELELIYDLMMKRKTLGNRVIPPLMRGVVHVDFTDRRQYFDILFELVLTLHSIPFDHPGLVGLMDKRR